MNIIANVHLKNILFHTTKANVHLRIILFNYFSWCTCFVGIFKKTLLLKCLRELWRENRLFCKFLYRYWILILIGNAFLRDLKWALWPLTIHKTISKSIYVHLYTFYLSLPLFLSFCCRLYYRLAQELPLPNRDEIASRSCPLTDQTIV